MFIVDWVWSALSGNIFLVFEVDSICMLTYYRNYMFNLY